MSKNVLCLIISFWVLCGAPANLSSQEVHLGAMSPRNMEITGITPRFEETGLLELTAELSEDVPSACPVTWRFKGPSHGYAFKHTEGSRVLLTIGEQQARVTVEACLSEGTRTGGCASLTLTADILDQAQDVAA